MSLIQSVSDLINYSQIPVHAGYYNYSYFSTLHAARVALVYLARSRAVRAGKQVTNRVDAAGFLVLAWGGAFIIYPTLGLIPPQMLSYSVLANYLSVFFLLRALPAPPGWLLDTALPVLDGLTRSMSITSTLLTCQSHPNPLVRNSVFLQYILGGLAASGGGMLGITLDVFSGEWKLQTPPILTGDFWANYDFLAGLAGTTVFSLTTSTHPVWSDLRTAVFPHASAAGLSLFASKATAGDQAVYGVLSAMEGRCLVLLLLAVLYAVKAYKMHWMGGQAKAVGVPAGKGKAVGTKKTQ